MSYDDELWGNFNSTPPKPLVDSDEESAGDVDDAVALLPEAKRKKYEKEKKMRKQVVQTRVECKEDSDSDLEIINEIKSASKDPVLQLDIASVPVISAKVVYDPHTQEILTRNQQIMENLNRATEEVSVHEDLTLLDDDSDEVGKENDSTAGYSDDSDSDAAEAYGTGKILVKVKCTSGEAGIRILPTDPFSKLFDGFKQFAIKKGWTDEATQIRFVFDGDVVQPNQTPQGLDLEGEEIIEAFWK